MGDMAKRAKHNDYGVLQNSEASELNVAKLPGSEKELGSFPTRLQQAIGERSVRSFASDCGLSDTVVRQYLSGKSEPTRPAIIAIARVSGCSIDWLLTGEGEMRRTESFKCLTEEDLAFGEALCRIGRDESESVLGNDKVMVADPGAPFAQDTESEELCRLLKRYGNRALIEDVKARLLKIKQVVEG